MFSITVYYCARVWLSFVLSKVLRCAAVIICTSFNFQPSRIFRRKKETKQDQPWMATSITLVRSSSHAWHRLVSLFPMRMLLGRCATYNCCDWKNVSRWWPLWMKWLREIRRNWFSLRVYLSLVSLSKTLLISHFVGRESRDAESQCVDNTG